MSIYPQNIPDCQQSFETLNTPSTELSNDYRSEQIPADSGSDTVYVLQTTDPNNPAMILVKPTSGRSADSFRNLNFEYAVGHLIEDVAQKRNLNITYQKWKEMNGDPLPKVPERREDGSGSNPEYEVTCLNNQNKVVVDAKNYDKTRIDTDEVRKMCSDMRVRQAKAGILVLSANASFSRPAWDKCQEEGIYVLRVSEGLNIENSEPSGKGVSRHAHPSPYDSDINRKYMDQILQAAVEDVSTPDILLTKERKVDRRSAYIRRGNDPQDGSIKYRKDGETVDGRTKLARESDHYHEIRQIQKTRVLNYNQDEAFKDYQTRDNARKDDVLQEKGTDQNNTGPESQDNIIREARPNVAEEPTGRTNQDGTPDMRDTANRADPTLKADGTPDERFAVNREVPAAAGNYNPSQNEQLNSQANPQDNTAAREPQQQTSPQTQPNVAEEPAGRANQDGTPDMRDTANREDSTLKADGTPDMRFASNREGPVPTGNSNPSSNEQPSSQGNEQGNSAPSKENTSSTNEGMTETINSNLNATTENNSAGPADNMNTSSGGGALDNNGGIPSTGPAETKSGSQQEGISSAQPNVADDPSGRTSQDGTPDMRDTSNRADSTLKADGTPDMRFSANK